LVSFLMQRCRYKRADVGIGPYMLKKPVVPGNVRDWYRS